MCVRTGGFEADAIRLGEALLGEPNLDNHIAVLSHKDKKNTWWCLEGRPGGVGWADATNYLTSPYTITNRNQPKTMQQRTEILYWMGRLINAKYDWDAIVGDGLRDLHLEPIVDPWAIKDDKGIICGDVVCSSAATFAYISSPCPAPPYKTLANVEPSDWTKFILDKNYA
jgi:hypothetical protein